MDSRRRRAGSGAAARGRSIPRAPPRRSSGVLHRLDVGRAEAHAHAGQACVADGQPPAVARRGEQEVEAQHLPLSGGARHVERHPVSRPHDRLAHDGRIARVGEDAVGDGVVVLGQKSGPVGLAHHHHQRTALVGVARRGDLDAQRRHHGRGRRRPGPPACPACQRGRGQRATRRSAHRGASAATAPPPPSASALGSTTS